MDANLASEKWGLKPWPSLSASLDTFGQGVRPFPRSEWQVPLAWACPCFLKEWVTRLSAETLFGEPGTRVAGLSVLPSETGSCFCLPTALRIEVCAEIQFINRWTVFPRFPSFNFQKQDVSVMAEILLVLGNPS